MNAVLAVPAVVVVAALEAPSPDVGGCVVVGEAPLPRPRRIEPFIQGGVNRGLTINKYVSLHFGIECMLSSSSCIVLLSLCAGGEEVRRGGGLTGLVAWLAGDDGMTGAYCLIIF